MLGNKGLRWVDRCRMVVVIEDKEGKEKGKGVFDVLKYLIYLFFFNYGYVNLLLV